jgi:polysaccharide biosynthesis PFTS motif protein
VATRPQEATYSRFPLLALFSRQRVSFMSAWVFLREHARALISFFAVVARAPLHCILWRDFAEHAAAAALNHSHCIDGIVITNTNWLQQFLWMNALENRRFKCSMALYSLNNHAIVYRSDPVSHAHPGLRHLKVDEVWVWNEPYRKQLAAEGVTARSVALEPILWYLPEGARSFERRAAGITLCVFDVQPRTTESSRASGSLLNYYNTDTAIRFIDDILRVRDRVSAREGIDIRIVLKHKRSPTPQHDRKYFDHIDELIATAACFEVVPNDSNVYALIAGSRLVIAPPYSSPAYVAAHVGVPAIFYDATGEVLPTHAPHALIRFIDGCEALEAAIAELAREGEPAVRQN